MSGHAIVRYPHMSSDISEDVKYSIVVGCFHSFRRAPMSLDSFVHSMADVVVDLAAKAMTSLACFRTLGVAAYTTQSFLACAL